ncbi:MAG: hypothetical protein M1837_000481 [Sclerophora amabilis]|nr:MAG: hypothetical protein M1837_000481 [Sclerophora amabilis]
MLANPVECVKSAVAEESHGAIIAKSMSSTASTEMANETGRRELSNLREKVDEYEAFLRQLTSEVDPSAQVAIERLLANSGSSALPSPATGKRRRPETEVDGDATANFEGEHLVSAEVGSVGSLDKCHEDINRDDSARTAGFFGKITDVAWITRVKDQLMAGSASDTKHGENLLQDDGPQLQRPYGPDAKNVLSPGNNSEHGPIDGDAFKNESWTYNLDDCDLGLPDRLNQLDLPPRRVADQLVDAYFTTVHPSFPLLLKRSFWQLYEQSFEAYHHPISDQDRAILNLVLAIGAKYAVVTRAGICDDRDHLAFFSKARSLSLDNGLMWHTGDLQQVQVAGLAASYLMAIGHTNR